MDAILSRTPSAELLLHVLSKKKKKKSTRLSREETPGSLLIQERSTSRVIVDGSFLYGYKLSFTSARFLSEYIGSDTVELWSQPVAFTR